MSNAPIDIGQTIVYGVMFDPKNGDRVARMELDELYGSVGRLFDLLEQREINYVLVGGIAMLAYVEGRNTQDIDLIVPTDAIAKLPELVIDDRNPDFARAWFNDLRVDLLFARKNLFSYVAKSCVTKHAFADRVVPCATPEGLLVMKLFALPSLYRQGRFEKVDIYEQDVTSLVRHGLHDIESHLQQLSKHLLDSDVQEVRKILSEITAKVQRPNRFGTDQ